MSPPPVPERRRPQAEYKDNNPPPTFRHGILKGDLVGPVSATSTPTTCDVWMCVKDPDSTDPFPKLTQTTDFIQVANYDPTRYGTVGNYCLIALVEGDWVFVHIGCNL